MCTEKSSVKQKQGKKRQYVTKGKTQWDRHGSWSQWFLSENELQPGKIHLYISVYLPFQTFLDLFFSNWRLSLLSEGKRSFLRRKCLKIFWKARAARDHLVCLARRWVLLLMEWKDFGPATWAKFCKRQMGKSDESSLLTQWWIQVFHLLMAVPIYPLPQKCFVILRKKELRMQMRGCCLNIQKVKVKWGWYIDLLLPYPFGFLKASESFYP